MASPSVDDMNVGEEGPPSPPPFPLSRPPKAAHDPSPLGAGPSKLGAVFSSAPARAGELRGAKRRGGALLDRGVRFDRDDGGGGRIGAMVRIQRALARTAEHQLG